MKKAFLTLIIISSLAGCINYDINEILLQREEISLTSKGVDQLTYDPLTCQMSYNESKNEFKVFRDNLSDWFVVTCDDRPVEEGQIIIASISWTAETNTHTIPDLEFEVMKTSDDGKIWMWCESAKIGVVVQILP
mgnify:FL=1